MGICARTLWECVIQRKVELHHREGVGDRRRLIDSTGTNYGLGMPTEFSGSITLAPRRLHTTV